MATKKNRTKSGPSATARKKFGFGKGSKNRTGSFPVFDKKSALSAIRLRRHAKSRAAVLTKVARWASSHHDATVKNKVATARKADKKR